MMICIHQYLLIEINTLNKWRLKYFINYHVIKIWNKYRNSGIKILPIQALWTGSNWNPGKHRHIGMLAWTKHWALGKQVAVSQGSSQLGPTLGSGHVQDPPLQMALPGHWLLDVHATAPPHLFVTGSKGAPLKHVHLKDAGTFWHL